MTLNIGAPQAILLALYISWHEDVYDEPYSYCPHCGARLVERSDA